MKNSSVTKIPCNLDRFFKYWLQFTAPIHKLQKKDMNILSVILRKRHELSQMITDENLVDNFLFSREVRESIIKEAGETKTSLTVTLSKLRKANIIQEGNKINKWLIPPLSWDAKTFSFSVIFDILGNDTTFGNTKDSK